MPITPQPHGTNTWMWSNAPQPLPSVTTLAVAHGYTSNVAFIQAVMSGQIHINNNTQQCLILHGLLPTGWSNPHTPMAVDVPSLHDEVHIEMADMQTSFASAIASTPRKVPVKKSVELPTTGNRPIQELYSYNSLKLDKARCKAFENVNKIQGPAYNWTTTYGIVGIEVEVENIRNEVPLECYWSAKPDNSLRNHGMEFVSIPLQVKQIQLALDHLYSALNQCNTPDFSNRTSIHIHLNCRDMTQDQLWVLCILYSLFEKHYYAFAGTRRLNSIFCVPIYRSNILGKLNNVIYGLQGDWQKYCGLNMMPLVANNVTGTYGTIEFRHLWGTSDKQQVMRWIDNILALRKLALSLPKEELITMIKEMNTSSSYKHLYAQLFKEEDRLLTNKRDFEECVSHVKRELFGTEYLNSIKLSDSAVYWTLCRNLGIRG